MLWNGNECGKKEGNENLKVTSSKQMITDEELGNVKYFSCLGSMVANDAGSTYGIKSRTAMATPAFNKKEICYHRQIVLKFKEETS
jgi:hypothetical protein